MVATRQSRSPILFHNDTICRGELAMIACRVVVVVAVAIPPRQAKQNYWLLLCGQSQYPVGCCCCGQSQNILFGLDDVGVPGGCIVLSSTSRYVITGHPVGSSVRTDDDAGLNQNMTNPRSFVNATRTVEKKGHCIAQACSLWLFLCIDEKVQDHDPLAEGMGQTRLVLFSYSLLWLWPCVCIDGKW